MAREIEFRGRLKSDGSWVYGDLIHDNRGACYIYPIDSMCLLLENEVGANTIGQFTGLRDKNGKKVFEGDILLWTRKNVHIEGRPTQDFSDKCIIYYDDDKCGFRFRCKLDFSDDRAKESYIEVVGNIYDNFELLNKK